MPLLVINTTRPVLYNGSSIHPLSSLGTRLTFSIKASSKTSLTISYSLSRDFTETQLSVRDSFIVHG